MSFELKVLASILLSAGALFVSFWVLLFGIFSGDNLVIFTAIFITLAGIPLLFCSFFAKRIKLRTKKWLWWAFFAIAIIPKGVNQAYLSYDRSFIRINEASRELYNYAPFRKGTKAAFLDEPSTLKLTDNLPLLDGARALYPLYAAFAQGLYILKKSMVIAVKLATIIPLTLLTFW